MLSYNYKDGYVARADLCYGYNTEGGCQKWQDKPNCRSPGDVFNKKSLRRNYENVTWEDNQNISHSDCEAACWSNCDCNGFKEAYVDGSGCRFYRWNSSKDIIVDGSVSGEDFYILENKGNITPLHHGMFNANFILFVRDKKKKSYSKIYKAKSKDSNDTLNFIDCEVLEHFCLLKLFDSF